MMRAARFVAVVTLLVVVFGPAAGADVPDGPNIVGCFLRQANPPLPKGNLRVIDTDKGQHCGTKEIRVYIAPGGAPSDRAIKGAFRTIDDRQILALVGKLPVSSWEYKTEGTRHVGPMAQDFYKLFHLGASDKSIPLVDGMGVNLAATKALISEVRTQQREIFALGVLLVLLMAGFGVYVTRVRSAR